MARKTVQLQFNNFVAGLVTEASPLVFPKNASVDEVNFVLNRDGSRKRRLGMDLESDHVDVTTNSVPDASGELAVKAFRWTSFTNNNSKDVAVIQVGSEIKFFDMDVTPLSDGLIHTKQYLSGLTLAEVGVLGFATIDGRLVVTAGERDVSVFEIDGDTVTEVVNRLKIRDLFGVEDIDPDSSLDIRDGNNISKRPETLSNEHLYNLRNQTWANPRKAENSEDMEDPIKTFRDYVSVFQSESIDRFSGTITTEPTSYFPSNSDNLNSGLFADPNDSGDRFGDRFWPGIVRDSVVGTYPAPQGYFIIDALWRGSSRLDELNKMYDRNEAESVGEIYTTAYRVNSLKGDYTRGGARVVESFAGRAFFAGFGGQVDDGDAHSPRMSSYVLFSQLIKSGPDVFKCYQQADPTSNIDSDLVDTDGGFIRVSGADEIVALKTMGESLLIFASNGVWALSGGTENTFTATGYRIDKITDAGCVAPESVVIINGTALYWAKDGIYQIQGTSISGFGIESITKSTIQTLYQGISDLDRFYCRGAFDKFDRKVRWIYNTRISSDSEPRELVLDVDLGAFYLHEIPKLGNSGLISAIITTPPFTTGEVVVNVTESDGEVVTTSDGGNVTVTSRYKAPSVRELSYVVLTETFADITFSFGSYMDSTFYDWKSVDGTGVDAAGYIVTGFTPEEDVLKYKQVPWLQMFFKRTEDGFTADDLGDLYPRNPSSCKVQARWEWANSAASNRWGREFQAYRYKRFYIPTDVSDTFDTGFDVLSTKNRLRGKGKVLSLKMSTEPGKDCRILGWSMIMGVNGNV